MMKILTAAVPSGKVLIQISNDDTAIAHAEVTPDQARELAEAIVRCAAMADTVDTDLASKITERMKATKQ